MSILRKLVDWWFNRTCSTCIHYRIFALAKGTTVYHCICPKVQVGNILNGLEDDDVWVAAKSYNGAIQPGREFGCIHHRNNT